MLKSTKVMQVIIFFIFEGMSATIDFEKEKVFIRPNFFCFLKTLSLLTHLRQMLVEVRYGFNAFEIVKYAIVFVR